MLTERRQLIAQGLANTEKIKAELAKTEAQREEVLAQANAQAKRLLEQARSSAARLRDHETQKAIAAAEQIMARARESAAADHTRMLAQLKREVGQLVVRTTAAIAGKILTTEDQRRLAEETARELTTP
jgi:F-type H+-transporting ATPase subunit b